MNWKPLVGYEEAYEITAEGQVRHIKYRHRTLGWHPNSKGYPRVHLSIGGRVHKKLLHLLVADTFIGPREKHTIVHHKDDDRSNPVASNLEYTTTQGNSQRAYKTGGLRRHKGETHEWALLTEDEVRSIRASNERRSVLAERYGVAYITIYQAQRGITWKHVT